MLRIWLLSLLGLGFLVPNGYPLTVEQAVTQALQKNADLQVSAIGNGNGPGTIGKGKNLVDLQSGFGKLLVR